MRDNYEPSQTTRTILMILCVCLATIILLLMSGCKTIHDVERIEVHDTLHVHHTDTVREVKVTHHTDTTRQVEQHYITLNQAGDTIKEIHHYHDIEHTIIVDSTDRYKAKNDSLQRLLDREREKEKVVEKKLSKWQQLQMWCGRILLLIAAGIAAIIAVKLIKHKL